MDTVETLLEANRRWADSREAEDPGGFARLAGGQNPDYMWIGCSDSRVPGSEIIGLAPGELFVHRNVANLVIQTDLNLLSVLQYAVEVLRVKHLIVCGHYGCGGVKAALDGSRHGLIGNWLRHIQIIASESEEELGALDPQQAADRLCELNVLANARNLARTTIVQEAWERGQTLSVHSWIYRLDRGRLGVLAEPIVAA